jgi:hypothetical protein
MSALKTLVALSAALAPFGSAGAQLDGPSRALVDPSTFNSCGIGLVTRLGQGRRLFVHADPVPRSPVVDRLPAGEYVYVCDEARDENYEHWYGLIYSRPDAACRAKMPRRPPFRINASCRGGWVRRDWVEYLTG